MPTNINGMCGEFCSVSATLGLPPFTACVLSQSTLLRLQADLQGNCLKPALGCVQVLGYSTKAQTLLGLRFVPFPGLRSSGDQVRGECSLSRCGGGGVRLITSPVPAAQFPGWQQVCLFQVCRASLLGSSSLAETLPVDVNRPESQEVLVSNWKPAHSLVGDAFSGAKFAPFWLWLPPTCFQWGMCRSAAG